MLRHFLNPPNWFTAASIFCSTYAVSLLLVNEHTPALLARACVLVVFAGIFDNLDGRVARLTKRQSDFGVQLDSIADILGFGLAPAVIAYAWKLHTLGWIGVAFTVWYVLCAGFRLARFNAYQSAWPLPGHSQGLTSTMSGGILVTLIWLSNSYLADIVHPSASAVGWLAALLGYLMVSSVPFRNFKDVKNSVVARRYLAISTAACVGGALFFQQVSMIFGIGGLLYLTVGLLDGLLTAAMAGILVPAITLGDIRPPEVEDEVEA